MLIERSTTKLSEHSTVMMGEERPWTNTGADKESGLGRKGMVGEGGDKIRTE